MLFQYANEANPRAHYEGTGAEIVARPAARRRARRRARHRRHADGHRRARCARRSPTSVVAAEPLPGDPVMGLRSLEDGYVPPILDVSKLDRKLLVSNAEAVAAARALLDREGIFAGVSSGAVVHVARRIADELPEGAIVVASSPTAAGSTSRRRSGRRRVEIDGVGRSGGDPGRDPRRAARARRGGGAERVLRRDRASRRRRRALRPRPQPLASPYRYELEIDPEVVVPRGRRLRARGLPLASGDRAESLAHRPRARRASGRAGRS